MSMNAHTEEIASKAELARATATAMSLLTTEQKNEALFVMADALIAGSRALMDANAVDIENGKDLSTSLLDRLALHEDRIHAMANGLRQIAALPDPIGETLERIERPNGLHITKIRVPLGVIGMIYEARPNVTVDAAGLCLKTGNAVVLRGGSAALHTNRAIVNILREALVATAVPVDALQLIEDPSRALVDVMLKLNGLLDVIIPRGGAALIRNVVDNATVPVIETGAGICHTYLDESAAPAMAEDIVLNAKVQRPSVCNAMETLLVHQAFAAQHLHRLATLLIEQGVELRGCSKTQQVIPAAKLATDADYATEYNDYILNIRVVDGLETALEHIRRFGTKHSECIVTEQADHATAFLNRVDAAAVYHNASTRFTDGFEFGFGAEIGISTQKLHARGPMGLPALTSTKYIILGSGQIRE